MAGNALGLLGIARKGGRLEVGEEPVGAAAQAGKARLIILASDAAEHTVRKANSYASLHDSPVISLEEDRDALGAVFGRNSVAMICLTDIQLAKQFLERLGQPEKYGEVLSRVSEKAARMQERKRTRGRK